MRGTGNGDSENSPHLPRLKKITIMMMFWKIILSRPSIEERYFQIHFMISYSLIGIKHYENYLLNLEMFSKETDFFILSWSESSYSTCADVCYHTRNKPMHSTKK